MQEPPWMPRTMEEYHQQLAEDAGPQPDEMVRLQMALDSAEQEIERLKRERDTWEERYQLADQTIHEAADLLLADIIEDDVAIDALVLDAIGRILTQRTNLILAVKTLGGFEGFAQCPCCLADRTNGEWHDDICPAVSA